MAPGDGSLCFCQVGLRGQSTGEGRQGTLKYRIIKNLFVQIIIHTLTDGILERFFVTKGTLEGIIIGK